MKRTFTYEEAVELLPVAQQLTSAAVAELERLAKEAPVGEEPPAQNEEVVQRWVLSITELGIEVKGLWLIDFDCGSGYYCWKYPEPALQYFHGYEEGFPGRVQLN